MECCLVTRQLLEAVFFVLICSALQAQQSDSARVIVTPSNITARIGTTARFDCQLPNGTGGFTRWARPSGMNFQMITDLNCRNCNASSNGSLIFLSIDQSHNGLYICFIVPDIITGASAYLAVAEAPSISIITPAGDLNLTEGGTLQINVYVTGVPQPSIIWRRDNKVIDEQDPRVMITGANLSLSNVVRADAGIYKITATNIANTVEESYNVIIQFMPVIAITRMPDRKMVRIDETVTVTCSVISHPQSVISWKQILEESEVINKTSTGTQYTNNGDTYYTTSTSSITFTADEIGKFSKFCCTASNSIRMDMDTITKCLNFTVAGTPTVPEEFKSTEVTSNTITVSWVSPSATDENNTNIEHKLSWYKNQSNILVYVNSIILSSNISSSNISSYTIKNLTANTTYQLMINAINTTNNKESLSVNITVRTPIAVPGKVENFTVEVIKEERVFRLKWQAPNDSQVEQYIIHQRVMDGETNFTIPGNSMSYDYNIILENVVYEFAVQPINNGGNGPISNYMAVFYCSTDPSLNVSSQRSTRYVNVMWTLNSGFESSGIYLTVERKRDNAVFTTEAISDDKSSQCINDLEPSTDYSITILATFNCDNVSSVIDFRTLSASSSSDGGPSIQGCIRYDPQIQTSDEPGESSDSGLESWAIALIVAVPIVAFVVMLSIGVICALQRRSSFKDPGELPVANNATSYRLQHDQQLLSHQRNNSSSTYTNGSTSDYRSGSVSPTRSALSYNNSRSGYPGYSGYPYRHPSIDVGSTIDENSSVATSV